MTDWGGGGLYSSVGYTRAFTATPNIGLCSFSDLICMSKLEKGGSRIRSVLAGDEVHHVAGETPVSQIDEVVGPA